MSAWKVTGSVNRCNLEVTHRCGHVKHYTYGIASTAEREAPSKAARLCERCIIAGIHVSPPAAVGEFDFLNEEDDLGPAF